MDLDSLDDDDAEQLARKIGPHLDPGSYGDRVVLTKRQFIAAASGTLGTGALLSLGVDEAAAQAAGSQGTASSPNNMFAYDLNVANGVTSSLPMNGNAIENAGSVSTNDTRTETIGRNDFHYAGDYAGSNPDSRLDNAISAASDGEMIYLENDAYQNNRTISKILRFGGPNGQHFSNTGEITGTWTLNNRVLIDFFQIGGGGSVIMDNQLCHLTNVGISSTGSVTISGDRCSVVSASGQGDVTLDSNSTNSLVDSTVGLSITDNGTGNVVGDNA